MSARLGGFVLLLAIFMGAFATPSAAVSLHDTPLRELFEKIGVPAPGSLANQPAKAQPAEDPGKAGMRKGARWLLTFVCVIQGIAPNRIDRSGNTCFGTSNGRAVT